MYLNLCSLTRKKCFCLLNQKSPGSRCSLKLSRLVEILPICRYLKGRFSYVVAQVNIFEDYLFGKSLMVQTDKNVVLMQRQADLFTEILIRESCHFLLMERVSLYTSP